MAIEKLVDNRVRVNDAEADGGTEDSLESFHDKQERVIEESSDE